jgi:hypothetical protein
VDAQAKWDEWTELRRQRRAEVPAAVPASRLDSDRNPLPCQCGMCASQRGERLNGRQVRLAGKTCTEFLAGCSDARADGRLERLFGTVYSLMLT